MHLPLYTYKKTPHLTKTSDKESIIIFLYLSQYFFNIAFMKNSKLTLYGFLFKLDITVSLARSTFYCFSNSTICFSEKLLNIPTSAKPKSLYSEDKYSS